jgi:hypothetical protein
MNYKVIVGTNEITLSENQVDGIFKESAAKLIKRIARQTGENTKNNRIYGLSGSVKIDVGALKPEYQSMIN